MIRMLRKSLQQQQDEVEAPVTASQQLGHLPLKESLQHLKHFSLWRRRLSEEMIDT